MNPRDFYFFFEDRYYAALDKINKFIPVHKIIDPIDRVFPSFVLLLLLLLALLLLFFFPWGGIIFPQENGTLVLTVIEKDPDEKVSGQAVKITVNEAGPLEKTTDKDGKIVLENYPLGTMFLFEVSREGFADYRKGTSLEEELQHFKIELLAGGGDDPGGTYWTAKKVRFKDEDGFTVTDAIKAEFECSSSTGGIEVLSGSGSNPQWVSTGLLNIKYDNHCGEILVSVDETSKFREIDRKKLDGEIVTLYHKSTGPAYFDEVCDDGEDNDGDGWVDEEDPDCDVNDPIELCSNGVDDDGDGLIDGDDPECPAGEDTGSVFVRVLDANTEEPVEKIFEVLVFEEGIEDTPVHEINTDSYGEIDFGLATGSYYLSVSDANETDEYWPAESEVLEVRKNVPTIFEVFVEKIPQNCEGGVCVPDENYFIKVRVWDSITEEALTADEIQLKDANGSLVGKEENVSFASFAVRKERDYLLVAMKEDYYPFDEIEYFHAGADVNIFLDPVPVEICDNGLDDDGDGKIDEADEDCWYKEMCGDGKDNDGDGLVDLDDPECWGKEICNNNRDDDGDGLTDLEDFEDCKPPPTPLPGKAVVSVKKFNEETGFAELPPGDTKVFLYYGASEGEKANRLAGYAAAKPSLLSGIATIEGVRKGNYYAVARANYYEGNSATKLVDENKSAQYSVAMRLKTGGLKLNVFDSESGIAVSGIDANFFNAFTGEQVFNYGFNEFEDSFFFPAGETGTEVFAVLWAEGYDATATEKIHVSKGITVQREVLLRPSSLDEIFTDPYIKLVEVLDESDSRVLNGEFELGKAYKFRFLSSFDLDSDPAYIESHFRTGKPGAIADDPLVITRVEAPFNASELRSTHFSAEYSSANHQNDTQTSRATSADPAKWSLLSWGGLGDKRVSSLMVSVQVTLKEGVLDFSGMQLHYRMLIIDDSEENVFFDPGDSAGRSFNEFLYSGARVYALKMNCNQGGSEDGFCFTESLYSKENVQGCQPEDFSTESFSLHKVKMDCLYGWNFSLNNSAEDNPDSALKVSNKTASGLAAEDLVFRDYGFLSPSESASGELTGGESTTPEFAFDFLSGYSVEGKTSFAPVSFGEVSDRTSVWLDVLPAVDVFSSCKVPLKVQGEAQLYITISPAELNPFEPFQMTVAVKDEFNEPLKEIQTEFWVNGVVFSQPETGETGIVQQNFDSMWPASQVLVRVFDPRTSGWFEKAFTVKDSYLFEYCPEPFDSCPPSLEFLAEYDFTGVKSRQILVENLSAAEISIESLSLSFDRNPESPALLEEEAMLAVLQEFAETEIPVNGTALIDLNLMLNLDETLLLTENKTRSGTLTVNVAFGETKELSDDFTVPFTATIFARPDSGIRVSDSSETVLTDENPLVFSFYPGIPEEALEKKKTFNLKLLSKNISPYLEGLNRSFDVNVYLIDLSESSPDELDWLAMYSVLSESEGTPIYSGRLNKADIDAHSGLDIELPAILSGEAFEAGESSSKLYHLTVSVKDSSAPEGEDISFVSVPFRVEITKLGDLIELSPDELEFSFVHSEVEKGAGADSVAKQLTVKNISDYMLEITVTPAFADPSGRLAEALVDYLGPPVLAPGEERKLEVKLPLSPIGKTFGGSATLRGSVAVEFELLEAAGFNGEKSVPAKAVLTPGEISISPEGFSSVSCLGMGALNKEGTNFDVSFSIGGCGTALGPGDCRDGANALPRVDFTWDWDEFGLNSDNLTVCDGGNEDFIFCDSAQFLMAVSHRLDEFHETGDENLLSFSSYLIQDAMPKEFFLDFAGWTSGTDFFGSPTVMKSGGALFNALMDGKVRRYPWQLPDAGLYSVELEFSSETAKQNFIEGEGLGTRGKINIVVGLLSPAGNIEGLTQSVFYYLPFDGEIGLKGEEFTRKGYGLRFANNSGPLPLNENYLALDTTGDEPAQATLISTRYTDLETLNSEKRGVMLDLRRSTSGATRTLDFFPSTPSPLLLELNLEEIREEKTAAVFYSLLKGEGSFSAGSSLLSWQLHGAECRDFSGGSERVLQDLLTSSADSSLFSSENASLAGTAYKLQWLSPQLTGWESLSSVAYISSLEPGVKLELFQPKEGTSAFKTVALRNAEGGSVEQSGTVELNGFGSGDTVNTLQDVFDLVKAGYACVKDSGNSSVFRWNEDVLIEELGGIETTDCAN